MKILNLFAGIGGNRTLWGDQHEITAIENDPKIAEIYQKRFPHDIVLVQDAYEYLEKHYNAFNFIWASPPCITHSQLNRWHKNKRIPDMRLYGIIIFLRTWTNCFWCVENVFPFYHAIIRPTARVGRHLLWANFRIPNLKYKGEREIPTGLKICNAKVRGPLKNQELNIKMNPEYGRYIFSCLMSSKQKTIVEYS